jgi:dTDP-4-dehydrorhamnose reductase
MTILILGANGMLGSDLVKVAKERQLSYHAATRKEADVTDIESLKTLINRTSPSAVINCTAMHDVPRCEKEPLIAMEVNCDAVFHLAKLCSERNIKFLTVSTDYVFDGHKVGGYTEADSPNPLMWYGRSKLAGEWAAMAANPKTFVVRSQSLYGHERPTGKALHFVDMIQKLASERDEIKVDQFIMSPTWTYPLAKGILSLLETDKYGLYHMSCHDPISWYDFAVEIVRLKNLKTKVTPVANDFFPRNFARPENSYLINSKLKELGMDNMPTWKKALQEYLS